MIKYGQGYAIYEKPHKESILPKVKNHLPAKKPVSYQLKIFFRHIHIYKCFGIMLNYAKYNINHISSLYKP